MSPARLVRRARAAGLQRVAITDHGAIAGAREAALIDPELVIIGEEMRCRNGAHLIGLFLTEHIPNGLSVAETTQRIHDQGGVVYAPHPYAYLVHARERAESVLAVADVVEVFNARAFAPSWNTQALAAATERALPSFAGTDGHFPWELGRAYTLVGEFTDAATLRSVMREAERRASSTTPTTTHMASIGCQLARLLVGSLHGSRPPFFR